MRTLVHTLPVRKSFGLSPSLLTIPLNLNKNRVSNDLSENLDRGLANKLTILANAETVALETSFAFGL